MVGKVKSNWIIYPLKKPRFFLLRNPLKYLLKQEAMDNINLFSVITIISFILLVPVAILIDGFQFTPSQLQIAVSEKKKHKPM